MRTDRPATGSSPQGYMSHESRDEPLSLQSAGRFIRSLQVGQPVSRGCVQSGISDYCFGATD
jgi:hypothetical protein